MCKTVIEAVEFKLKPDVEVANFIEAAKQSASFIQSLDGFIKRTLSSNEDGLWMDIVEWKDMASAKSAADTFMQAHEVMAFCAMIDMDTTKMQHLHTQLTR